MENQEWNHIKLEELYPWHQLMQIKSITIPYTQHNDFLIWKGASTGRYTPSKGYITLVQERDMSDSSPQSIHWNRFWKLNLPRKILLFIWKLINSALPVGDILRAHHLNSTITCVFCQDEAETVDHLFMHCHFARAVWFGSPLCFVFMQDRTMTLVQRLTSFCVDWLKDDDRNLSLLSWLFVTLHKIWEARNNLHWRGVEVHPLQLIQSIQEALTFYSNSTSAKTSSLQNNQIAYSHKSTELSLSRPMLVAFTFTVLFSSEDRDNS